MLLLFLFRPFIFPFTFNLNPQNLSLQDFSTDAYSLFFSTLCGFGGETCASSAAARSARSEESRTLRAATIPAGV